MLGSVSSHGPLMRMAARDSKPHEHLGHCIYNPLKQGELSHLPQKEGKRSGVHGRAEARQLGSYCPHGGATSNRLGSRGRG